MARAWFHTPKSTAILTLRRATAGPTATRAGLPSSGITSRTGIDVMLSSTLGRGRTLGRGGSGEEMKLWVLEPVENIPEDESPWEPWYDKCFGFVIRAEDQEAARSLADQSACYENREHENQHPWLMPKFSSCTELTMNGLTEVVISDVRMA